MVQRATRKWEWAQLMERDRDLETVSAVVVKKMDRESLSEEVMVELKLKRWKEADLVLGKGRVSAKILGQGGAWQLVQGTERRLCSWSSRTSGRERKEGGLQAGRYQTTEAWGYHGMLRLGGSFKQKNDAIWCAFSKITLAAICRIDWTV